MPKIAFVFPGQGSQYVGMGKDICEKYEEAAKVFETANRVLGFDLRSIVFEGPEETLKQTQYTQAAIFTTSIALFNVLAGHYPFDAGHCLAAGHSLGEYSAMCAAGFFSFEDGLKMVKARGEYIAKACQNNPGTMAAIIGLDKDKLAQVCKDVSAKGVCEMVNFNSPGQIVIAGTFDAVNAAAEAAKAAGALKAVVLNVSGPFHSTLMNDASTMMKSELTKYKFTAPSFGVYTNCDAQLTLDEKTVNSKLVKQISNPVMWEDSIKAMVSADAATFVEVGPGKVLSGLIRRIDKSRKMLNIEDSATLLKTIEALKA